MVAKVISQVFMKEKCARAARKRKSNFMKSPLSKNLYDRSFGIVLLITLCGCSAQTLYQPNPEPRIGNYGYSELPIDSERYEVTFTGDYDTPTETIDQYALYRSAEITAAHGYDYFIVEHTRHWNMRYHRRVQLVTTYKIRMYHGERPDRNPNSYKAREMIDVMGPTIKRPS